MEIDLLVIKIEKTFLPQLKVIPLSAYLSYLLILIYLIKKTISLLR